MNYKTSNNSTLPDYIKNLSGAQRTKYFDNLIMIQPEVAIFPFKFYKKNPLIYVQVVGSIIAFKLLQNINWYKRIFHTDGLQKNRILFFVSQTGPTTYDAWKEDMAVVNIFFGQNTLKGETTVPDDVNQFGV